MTLLRKLWADDAGFIISAELVLVATIVVIGLIVGLVVVRNQVVQELVDVGQAIGALNQSYSFTGVHGGAGKPWWTGGSEYIDKTDFCEVADRPRREPGGISVRASWLIGEDNTWD